MMKTNRKLIVSLLLVTVIVSLFALSSCDVDWDYCQHTLEEIEKQDSSCMKVGKKTAYKCTKCGEMFAYGYLNGKDGEKGLYHITNQEMLDYSNHKVGEFYGDLKSDMTTFDASSLEDFSVWSTCSEEGCGEPFEIPEHHLVAFAPNTNTSGKATAVTEGEATDATRFEIAAGTKSGRCIVIYSGSGDRDNSTAAIPFSANTDRHVILFFHNDGNQDVDIRYGSEFYGMRVGVDVTIPAGGYACGYFNLNIADSNKDSYHELYINTDIEETFNITISGYYYHEARLQGIKLSGYPQTEYAIGETFNPEGLEVVATYGGIDRKIKVEDCKLVLNNNKSINQPLTAEDNKVYVIYENKQIEFEIKVKRFEQTLTLLNSKFADGTTSKVLDRNALIPSDITATNGKTIEYFIDQYGGKYVLGEGKVPAYNAILSPVYTGEKISDNYALGATVSVSSTSHGGKASELVDGMHCLNSTIDGRWSSASNYETSTPAAEDRQWVIVDLGESKSISHVVLYTRAKGVYFPEGYEILVSADGDSWNTVVTVEKDELASQNSMLARWNNFNNVDARYVKVVATKMTADNGAYGYIFQLSEIEIYSDVSAN